MSLDLITLSLIENEHHPIEIAVHDPWRVNSMNIVRISLDEAATLRSLLDRTIDEARAIIDDLRKRGAR